MQKQIFTRDEAAEFLGMAPKTLANMASAGRGPAIYGKPTPKRVYYHEDELLRWIRENGAQARKRRGA